jgi:3-deoxy-D-manno-octulosonic-acid transferase
MYFLYSFFLAAWIIFMLPFFFYKARVSKKYLPKLRERMGNLPESLKPDGRPTIWFHSCSVGETLSVQPLAHALHERFPHARFVFSVITQTGRKIAEDRFDKYGQGNVFYFPIDLPTFVNRVLNHIQPQILICIDTEIWPNVIHECRKRNIPVFLANGRISAQSFQYYRWLQPLLAPVLSNYTMLLMKSEEDSERIRRMGAQPSRIKISGNIKYDRDVVEKHVAEALRTSIDRSFGIGQYAGPVIVAGSTHDREEEVLFDVLAAVRREPGLERTRLLIAPRHPERFETVAALAARMGHSVAKRTDEKPDPNASVLLLNTVGDLATAYSFATVATVGGTLIPFGGQSIMEPALYGKAIVIGPSMENFPKIIDDFRERQAIWQISAGIDQPDKQRTQLAEAFVTLLNDDVRRAQLGERAESIFEESKGATAFTVEHISGVFATVVR